MESDHLFAKKTFWIDNCDSKFTSPTVSGVGPSIFDSILLMKKIPAMPTLRASARALQPVKKALKRLEFWRNTISWISKSTDSSKIKRVEKDNWTIELVSLVITQQVDVFFQRVQVLDHTMLSLCLPRTAQTSDFTRLKFVPLKE